MTDAEQIYYDLVRHKKRGPRPKNGDIFAFEIKDVGWFFGRVVKIDSMIGGFGGSTLCYFYKHKAAGPTEVPDLFLDQLLIPPMAVPRYLWTSGYCLVQRNEPLTPTNTLEKHCFYEIMSVEFVDEHGEKMKEVLSPYGTFTIAEIGALANKVAETWLGKPPESVRRGLQGKPPRRWCLDHGVPDES